MHFAFSATGYGLLFTDQSARLFQRPTSSVIHPRWLELANTMNRTGELDLADRAYLSAFATEPANAQILWDRARINYGMSLEWLSPSSLTRRPGASRVA